jgi:hypothetical protein
MQKFACLRIGFHGRAKLSRPGEECNARNISIFRARVLCNLQKNHQMCKSASGRDSLISHRPFGTRFAHCVNRVVRGDYRNSPG